MYRRWRSGNRLIRVIFYRLSRVCHARRLPIWFDFCAVSFYFKALNLNDIIMRNCIPAILFVVFATGFAYAQSPCNTPALFTPMPNHLVRSCDEKEFDELEIYQNDKAKGRVTFVKQGFGKIVVYKFGGDFNNRPSPLQITQNYANALQKAGGELLYKTDGDFYGKVKKSDGTYWIRVNSDGSGDYRVYTIKEAAMRQDVVMTADEIKKGIHEEGKVVFYGIYFDTDKATLKAESTPTLAEIAKFLKANPTLNVFIVGHTDNTGDYAHNMALAQQRASAVVAQLTGTHGVGKSQVTAQGVGPLAPVATNDTKEGQARNRRVEVVKK